jgi:MoxR-like ATPase
MLYRFQEAQPLETLSPVLTSEALLALVPTVRAVQVSESIANYLLAIVRATREHPAFELGASPRAALALFRACQSLAAISGRPFVLPDDVKQLAQPVLAHRLVVTAQSRLHGQDAAQILDEILERTPVPVERMMP